MKSEYIELDIFSIELDKGNPRIKQYLEHYREVTSEGISLALKGSSESGNSYSILKESIKVNKGIIHPIIVNKDSDGVMTVIEGNTRLQIYREFYETDPAGPWKNIRSIVFDNLDVTDIHSIRLQSHLVGPREWDPYSKAKYLNQLSNVDYLPLPTLISLCGGNATEINKLINSYNDMEKYYRPIVENEGMDFSTRDFSKFIELQNKAIIESLVLKGFTKSDFSKWVVKGNIDKALNVRNLPNVLAVKEAREEFLRSNISNAMKKVHISQDSGKGLKSATLIDLCLELACRFRNIMYSDITSIRDSSDNDERRYAILSLYDELKEIIIPFIVEQD